MSNYKTSSQNKNWRFASEDQIKKIREKRYKKSNKKIREAVDKHNKIQQLNKDQGLTYNFVNFHKDRVGKSPILTFHDEQKMLNATLMTAMKVCEHLKFDKDVMNTSLEYIKRFFLRQSFYDFDAVDIMFSAVFLAIKIEEVNLTLYEFARSSKNSSIERIVLNEQFLIKGLKFQFFIYSPYRSFDGIFSIMEDNKDELYLDEETLMEFKDLGYKVITQTHFTDLSFLYSPLIIAFASFSYVYKNLLQKDVIHDEKLVRFFKKSNILKPDFWERKESQCMDEIYTEKVIRKIEAIHERHGSSGEPVSFRDKINKSKKPDVSTIKNYKKYIKGIHLQLPNYLKDKEKERKLKEEIPVDFMSDDERKEEAEIDGFKPPKPIKQKSKRSSNGKNIEAPTSVPPIIPGQDVEMTIETNKNEMKEHPEDMVISLNLSEK